MGEDRATEGREHRARAYERADVSPRPIWGIGVALLILLLLTFVGLRQLDQFLRPSRVAVQAARQTEQQLAAIPKPQLVADPADLQRADRREKQARLASYGWVDQSRGIVHIPVERAIDALVNAAGKAKPQSGGKQ